MIFNTGVDAFLGMLETVQNDGRTVSPRGRLCKEILDVQIIIEKPWLIPLEIPNRNLNNFIGIAEGLQLVGQFSVPQIMTDRVSAFAPFLDDGFFHGAYGLRIAGQLNDLVRQIENDRETRQAVLTIFDSNRDLDRVKNDIPCTIAIQYLIRKDADGVERLRTRVIMRSNDLWLGFPYDVVQFAMLQAALAAHFDIPMGAYSHNVGSLHLYQTNEEQALKIPKRLNHLSHVNEDYKPLWAGSIGEISGKARDLFMDKKCKIETEFEFFIKSKYFA